MAEISFGGLATGLPTEDLVSSLMAIERQPLNRLEAKKETETKRLEAYAQFNTLLGGLRDAVANLNLTSDVRTTSVRLSSNETISASSNGAATGSYDIAVAQLAQVQKTVTAGYSSRTAAVFGSGTFAINNVAVQIDSTNNSLDGLMGAINSVSAQTGVTASIINDGSTSDNFHLVLTGKDAATSFSLTYNLQDGQGAPIAIDATHVRAAQQAVVYVDGIEVVANTNTLTGVIAGVTLNLNQTSAIVTPGDGQTPPVYATTNLTVEADTGALKEKVGEFVTAYNKIMEWIVAGYEVGGRNQQTGDAADGDEAKDQPLSDLLRGDATINKIKRSLQSLLSTGVDSGSSLQILAEIGITTRQDGTLNLNASKLDDTLATKFDDVVGLLAGQGSLDGVMKRFNTYLRDVTSTTSGMYADKRARYTEAVKRFDQQIDQKEALMGKIEERIRNQFTSLELLVSNLNAQSNYLTQQMDIIANMMTKGRK
ncbi:flagellar filament capping protein FliD [Desulfofustis limnaeus]|uniref:Flagellar hook-associated protein 2 n=1 Tax=Desulfofustis limnaeus TaxID=2740163 RepID=A0ABN6M590_9BACT|nr:flagellar filament capping protein FliD [Desulfofustis limnaeus]BDD87370.1 flagellar hook-associated protein 2 [Desulfofustis limnaeus]